MKNGRFTSFDTGITGGSYASNHLVYRQKIGLVNNKPIIISIGN